MVEGDGISPDSLLEVRLFKEYIKHVSNYAVNFCVEIIRVDGVEDAMVQHERAVKSDFHTGK